MSVSAEVAVLFFKNFAAAIATKVVMPINAANIVPITHAAVSLNSIFANKAKAPVKMIRAIAIENIILVINLIALSAV